MKINAGGHEEPEELKRMWGGGFHARTFVLPALMFRFGILNDLTPAAPFLATISSGLATGEWVGGA